MFISRAQTQSRAGNAFKKDSGRLGDQNTDKKKPGEPGFFIGDGASISPHMEPVKYQKRWRRERRPRF